MMLVVACIWIAVLPVVDCATRLSNRRARR